MTRSTIIRRKDASLLTEKTKVAKKFKNYFERIHNQPIQNKEKSIIIERNLEKLTVEDI